MSLPTLEVLFAPSVVGTGYGNRLVLGVTEVDNFPPLDTGTAVPASLTSATDPAMPPPRPTRTSPKRSGRSRRRWRRCRRW